MLGVMKSGGLKTWNNQSSCIEGHFTLAGLRVAWDWAWAVSLRCLSQIWVPAKDSLNSTPFSSIGLLPSPFKTLLFKTILFFKTIQSLTAVFHFAAGSHDIVHIEPSPKNSRFKLLKYTQNNAFKKWFPVLFSFSDE